MKKLFLISLAVLLISGLAIARDYTYVDLVNQLTDLEGLAVLPAQGETCAQWSSYDRASRYDAQTEKYVGWDANGDGGGVIRPDGSGFVVAEMEGPGCIRRIWSAMPKEGHVRIYLDGNPEPVVDLPFIGYFDGKNAPFTYGALVHTVALGWNNYVPIPYQKSCKIVMDKDWGAYYQFVYVTYPKGTTVPTFSRDLSAEELAALDKADRFLRKKLGTDPVGHRDGEVSRVVRAKLNKDELAVGTIRGPKAITGLWVKLDPNVDESVLRYVDLRISWDGEENPSVSSPIGDFFGTGPGVNKYRSLPLGMTDDGFYSYWYMPFATEAKVEIINHGDKPFAGQITVTTAALSRSIQDFGRFHAKWHRDAFLPKEAERWIDWPMLKTEGKGRFCGVALEVWNPKGGWWGEGDEKFFVDGELFPSTIGTGSEDYFGYAWCNPTLFQNAYHNQTRVTNNVGHVAVNRWHITDNIPFQTSFEGDIEKYYLNDRPTLYASTVYWYLSPDGSDPYKAVPVRDRSVYPNPPRLGIPGAIEGESLKAEVTGGNTSIQDLAGKWSGDAHLWWTQGKPGDLLKVTVPVKKTGRYDFIVALTKARDYGIVELSLDGMRLGGPIDLYDPNVVPTGEISLGIRSLNAGDHVLSVEITGANEQAIKAYMFGLDYVRLVKARVKPDMEKKATIHGVVSGIDGKPIADAVVRLMDAHFTELHVTNTDADGQYNFHVPVARYYALYAVKDYRVNCLEYWCWDLPADHDLVINPFVHRLEVYSLTMSEVRHRGLESFILFFRPMGLTAAQAFMKERPDSHAPHVQIAPDLSTSDVTVKINGYDAPVYQIVKMEETTTVDSDDPAKSTSTMDAYVLQVGKPKQITTRSRLFCQVHIRDSKTQEEGEGGVFWEAR